MGSIAGYTDEEVVGLRVVRGPNWKWGAQDGGEGFVGTVVKVAEKNSKFVKVRWDSGEENHYRAGVEENSYDLRILDNSAVGVKHSGVKCQECDQKDIVGMRWQCVDFLTPFDLCTFCFTNGKHEQTHVNFKRYDRPSSVPVKVCLTDKQKIQLKGIFPGAPVKRGVDWKYNDEDGNKDVKGIDHAFGKVMPAPNGREMSPGKVWVQWSHDTELYSYRVGYKGKMDLKIANAENFSCGRYQPDTLPILEISESSADEKLNYVVADIPFVIGDSVKLAVGLEELREMMVDSGVSWNAPMKKLVNTVGTIMKIDNRDDTVKVVFPKDNNGNATRAYWFPVKAMRRLIPWLPVGAVVQVSNKESSSKATTNEKETMSDFGRVKEVRSCGEKVMLEFLKPDGRTVIKPFHVNQLKVVDVSVNNKMESIRKKFAILLLSEIKKGATLSVEYLIKNFPNMIDCINSRLNDTSYIAFKEACRKGNMAIVKLLLEHKESWIGKEEEDELKEDSAGPIHNAVYGNKPEVLRLLLDKGYNINHRDSDGDTPLHVAVKSRHFECLRILLEKEECDPNLKNKKGNTPVDEAVKDSHLSVETLNIFRDAGKLNLTNKANQDVVHVATVNNNLGAVKFLMSLPEGRKLAQNREGALSETALHRSCRLGHNKIAKLLVEKLDEDENRKPLGIDIPVSGKTPLMKVIQKRNCELIETLIGAGASLHAISRECDTAFHFAVRLLHNKKSPAIPHPLNGVTSPEIFKIYNEVKLNNNHHDDNLLCLTTAIVLYIVKKGGIPQNLTLPEIKNLIGDDFLYDEITKIWPDSNSTSQSFDNQSNALECSQSTELNGIDGYSNVEDELGWMDNIVKELFSADSSSTQQDIHTVDISNLLSPAQDSLPLQSELTTRDYVSSISQQPFPLSQQHEVTLDNFHPNENVAVTVTPTIETAAANIIIATVSVGEHLTPSDNNGPFPAAIDVPHLGEATNNQNVPDNNQPTAVPVTVDPVKADNSARPSKKIICTVEEKQFRKRKNDGSADKQTSLIIIDESGKRYSQQKKNICDIFQCTANVSSANATKGSKKCRGTIEVTDFNGILEELKKDKGKKFSFEVGNPHENHLPNKRATARQSTETESDSPGTSSKRRKKT